MLHTVKKVEYVERYRIKLHFDDKSVKIVDLENMLRNAKNMFLPLKDIAYFKQVKCDGITINWPNGVDLCPDVLYKMGKNLTQSVRKPKKTSPVFKIRKKSRMLAKKSSAH